jgi:hypothetical protein
LVYLQNSSLNLRQVSARLGCGRSWFQAQIGSNQRLIKKCVHHKIGFFPFHRGITWPSLVKFQYTELKLLCGNVSSVYWIFNKLGHMMPLWKGKNPIYFGVIRSKIKVTYYK